MKFDLKRLVPAACLIGMAAALTGVSSCDPADDGMSLQQAPPPAPSLAVFDQVKWIAPGVAADGDPGCSQTCRQEQFTVGPSSHIAMVVRTLKDHVGDIVITSGNPIQVQLTVTDAAQATEAQAGIEICPIPVQWNLLANWTYAYAAPGGNWQTPGGDYDVAGCVRAAAPTDANLLFDVTQWFKDYPKGRGVNYGFMVISDRPITIAGDLSGSYSPRLLWFEQH